MPPNNMYLKVVAILQDYLGPTSARFTERLISFHLKKSPEDLSKSDLPKLIEWIKVSLSLLTSNKAMVDDCEQKLLKLR